jgi:hypothetical protein
MPGQDEVDSPNKKAWKRSTPKNAKVIECEPVRVPQEFEIMIRIRLPKASALTTGAPSSWQLWMEGEYYQEYINILNNLFLNEI